MFGPGLALLVSATGRLADSRDHRMGGPVDSITVAGPREFLGAPRDRFTEAAIAALDSLVPGNGELVVDLSDTSQLDTAGIGTLVTIQKEAASRRLAVRLVGLSEEMLLVLVLTRLDDRFELETA